MISAYLGTTSLLQSERNHYLYTENHHNISN